MRRGVWIGLLAGAACGRSADVRRADSSAPRGPAPTAGASDARPRADSGAAAATSDRGTVLFIGTSLTAGLGLDQEDAYPALLQRKADSAGFHFEFVNAGLSGETSAGALRRLDWLLRQPAEVIVLETGANDGLRGLDVDSTGANIRAIVRKIRAVQPHAVIVLAQMEALPNLGPSYTTRFHAMFQTIAREEGLVLMPFLLDKVAGVAQLNQADGVHPNRRGERIVADNVWGTLRPLLEERAGRHGH